MLFWSVPFSVASAYPDFVALGLTQHRAGLSTEEGVTFRWHVDTQAMEWHLGVIFGI